MGNSQASFTINVEIGVRLRAERRRLGLNQTDMARAGGVELNSQSAFETAKRLPSTEYLLRTESIGLDPAYVLTGLRHSLDERLSLLVGDFGALSSEWQELILAMIHQAAKCGVPLADRGGAGVQ